MLPSVERWEIGAEHGSAGFLTLAIPDAQPGDSNYFIEPRNADEFFILVHFAEPFPESDFRDATAVLAQNDGTYSFRSINPVRIDEDNAIVSFQASAPAGPVSVAIRIFDPTGVLISERKFALIPGDVNGDGIVNSADQSEGPGVLGGVSAGASELAIRSDLDLTGLVEEAADGDIITTFYGASSPGDPPDFDNPVPPGYTYTVTFDADGGTPTGEERVVTSPATTVDSLATEPTLVGFFFGGWWTEPGGAGTEFTTATPVTVSITVFAFWSAVPTYTVTFDSNGGSIVPADTVPEGDLVTEPVDPVRLGHTFGGWYADAGLTTPWDFAADTVTADVTLYAQWTAISYEIIYNANGGTGTMANQPVTFGDTVTLNANTFTRAGYQFVGWSDTAGGVVIWSDADSYTHDIEVDRTQYAVWEQEYTVTYTSLDADGGIAPGDANVYIAGETVTVLGNTGMLVRTGYTFGGWTDGVTNYVAGNTFVMPSNNVSLDPIWVPQFAGGDGTSIDPYQVATATHLNNVRNHLGAWFEQTANIDLGVSPWNELAGWAPIGTETTPFTGVYDGGGLTISGLTISLFDNNVGLFGRVDGATIERVRLEGVSVFGLINTGALVGSSALTLTSVVRDSYATGVVDSDSYHVGGLIGFAGEMAIERSFSAVSVSSTLNSANLRIGGLVGMSNNATINDSYAVGTVTAGAQGFIGGLLGGGTGTTINRSYAAGRVTTAGATAGGLVGDGTFVNVTDAFYDTYTTGMTDTGNGFPLPSAAMLQQASFPGWEFVPTLNAPWVINPDTSYPYLEWYTGPAPVPATAFALRDVGPAGGWVFYDKGSYVDGWRYMEAAPTDASVGIGWGDTVAVTLTSVDVGTGLENTDRIISVLGAGTYAAQVARSQTTAGFTDWFLPSADELHLMYLNLHAESVGGFAAANHWSSTASGDNLYAFAHYFNASGTFVTLRNNNLRVRPARRF